MNYKEKLYSQSLFNLSCSHLLITLFFPYSRSCIQLIDLAGCSNSLSNIKLQESLLLNKSLSAVQNLLSAISNKQRHIPFRNSLLTSLLKPSISSNFKINLLLHFNPNERFLKETISTLSISSRVAIYEPLIFKSLKNAEIERTYKLLEKERKEKQQLLIMLDKIQRDIDAYQFATKNPKKRHTLKETTNNIILNTSFSKIPRKKCINRVNTQNLPIKSYQSCLSSPKNNSSRIPALKLKLNFDDC